MKFHSFYCRQQTETNAESGRVFIWIKKQNKQNWVSYLIPKIRKKQSQV